VRTSGACGCCPAQHDIIHSQRSRQQDAVISGGMCRCRCALGGCASICLCQAWTRQSHTATAERHWPWNQLLTSSDKSSACRCAAGAPGAEHNCCACIPAVAAAGARLHAARPTAKLLSSTKQSRRDDDAVSWLLLAALAAVAAGLGALRNLLLLVVVLPKARAFCGSAQRIVADLLRLDSGYERVCLTLCKLSLVRYTSVSQQGRD
jgi:hypothetical protein